MSAYPANYALTQGFLRIPVLLALTALLSFSDTTAAQSSVDYDIDNNN